MAQLNFLSENLKEIFPPQLPGRKYVTESSLGIVGRELKNATKLLWSICFDQTFCLVHKCFVSSICKFHYLSGIFYLIRPLINTVNVLISPKSKYKPLHLNAGTGPIVTNKLPTNKQKSSLFIRLMYQYLGFSSPALYDSL